MPDPYYEITTIAWAGEPPSHNIAPSLARLSNGNLLVVWSANEFIPGSLEADPQSVLDVIKHPGSIKAAISEDNGSTWSDPVKLAEGADGDPTVFVVGARVVLHYTSVPYLKRGAKILYRGAPEVYERVSEDHGRTFTTARRVALGENYWGCRSNPLVLRNGRIVWPFYYVENADVDVLEKDMRCVVAALISDDRGSTWRRGGEIRLDLPNGADEPTIVELSNGDLYMLIRTTAGSQYEALSSDGGLTWSPPAPSVLSSPSAPATLLRLSFDPNQIVVVWNDSPQNRYPLNVAMSLDDCRTWEYSRVLVNPGRQVAYPSIAQAADGMIVVAYHEAPDRDKVKWFYMRHIMAARVSEAWIRS